MPLPKPIVNFGKFLINFTKLVVRVIAWLVSFGPCRKKSVDLRLNAVAIDDSSDDEESGKKKKKKMTPALIGAKNVWAMHDITRESRKLGFTATVKAKKRRKRRQEEKEIGRGNWTVHKYIEEEWEKHAKRLDEKLFDVLEDVGKKYHDRDIKPLDLAARSLVGQAGGAKEEIKAYRKWTRSRLGLAEAQRHKKATTLMTDAIDEHELLKQNVDNLKANSRKRVEELQAEIAYCEKMLQFYEKGNWVKFQANEVEGFMERKMREMMKAGDGAGRSL